MTSMSNVPWSPGWGVAAVSLSALCWCQAAYADTTADFDSAGTLYALATHCSATTPEVTSDATSNGNFLRLAHASGVIPECNTLSFERTDLGLYARVRIAFDFRLGPAGVAAADGIGVTLLNSATVQPFGVVATPNNVAEEPNFPRSLGVGIDIHDFTDLPESVEPSANHISIHFGEHRTSFAIPQEQLVLASGEWTHAELDVDMQAGELRIELSREAHSYQVELDVAGLSPYEARVHFAARSGGLAANHDLDNIHVEFAGTPDPMLYGSTSEVIKMPSVPINLHVLPTGRVLFWDRGPWQADDGTQHCTGCDRTPRVWDPASPAIFEDLPLPSYDLFCSGHQFLPDGRLFVAGGHIQDSVGALHATIFDPSANTFTDVADMHVGRWYPSVATLETGDVVVLTGEQTPGVTAQTPERYDFESGTWNELSEALPNGVHIYYPFAYLVREGQIFIAGPQQQAYLLDARRAGQMTEVAASTFGRRDYGSSAMYRPGQVIISGGSRDVDGEGPTASAELIDVNATSPSFTDGADMLSPRRHHTLTLLADGSVLASGGSSVKLFNDARGSVHVSEIWHPASDEWRPVMGTQVRRLYHSVAALLPDASVLVAGGGHPADGDHGDEPHPDAEIFSPPYLFRGQRPVIVNAPERIEYGQSFEVEVAFGDASGEVMVSWVRLSSVTHGFNQNQRFQFLTVELKAGPMLRIAAPLTPWESPPGHYMLFVLDEGVPSVARIIQIAAASGDGDEEDDSDGGVGAQDGGATDADAGVTDGGAGDGGMADGAVANGPDSGPADGGAAGGDGGEPPDGGEVGAGGTGVPPNVPDGAAGGTDDAAGPTDREEDHGDAGAGDARGNRTGCECGIGRSGRPGGWVALLVSAVLALRRRHLGA